MVTGAVGLWQNRQYRLFLQAACVCNLGDGIALLALPWLASMIAPGAAQIALVTAALRLPWLLFSIPAGVMADRFDRRALLLWADAVRLLMLLSLAWGLFLWPGDASLSDSQAQTMIWLLALLAFVLGSAEVVRDNTAQTLLPALVGERQLEQANGQLWSAEQLVGQFVGPPLAGWLLLQSQASPFVVNALCVALAWYWAFLIRLPRSATVVKHSSIWLEVREAIAWLYRHTQMLRLALMLGVINFLIVGALTVLVLFSQEVLGLSAAEHGLLLTAGALGGVVGGLLCPRIVVLLGANRSVHLALLLGVVPYVLIASSHHAVWVALALLIEMFGALLWNVVTVSLRQRTIPTALLGRVNSVYRLIGWGMMPLGALAAGYFVDLAQQTMAQEMALRLYYVAASVAAFLLFVYGVIKLRIDTIVER